MSIMLKRNYVLLASNQGCPSKRKKIEEKLRIPPDYSYPIVRIDGDWIILKNEWGAERQSPWFGYSEIKLRLAEFKQLFESVVVNKIMV